MRFPIVMLAALCTTPTLSAQSPRDTLTSVIVGRRETAEIAIDYVPKVPRHTTPWGENGAPIHPGLGEPIYLRTTLPLRFDGREVPAGRYQLMTVLGAMPTLVVQAVGEDGTAAYTAARVPMEVTELERSNGALAVQVRTTRVGEDVVQIVDRSTPRMTRLSKEIAPGTTKALVIQLGKHLMRVPISAR